MSLNPRQSEIPKLCLQFWLIQDTRRRDLQILPLVIRSRVICQVSASSNCKMGMPLPHAVKVINFSRNVQVRCPLLELCSGHMVVFQMKVPQISLIRQLIDESAKRASPSGFLRKIEPSSDRSREFPDRPGSNVADGFAGLEVLFFFFAMVYGYCVLLQICAFL